MLSTLPRHKTCDFAGKARPFPAIDPTADEPFRRFTPAELAAAVDRYGPRLLAVARRQLPCEADCADAVQEAYLSALRGLPNFRGESELGTWLHRIVVNVCLMKRRAERVRRAVPIEEVQLPPNAPSDVEGPWSEASRDAVRRALRQLPERQRTVIQLRYFEGFTTAETACLLGVRPEAVKTRLHRSCRALGRELRRSLPDPE